MKHSEKIRKIWKENQILLIAAVLFAALFAFANMGGDDVTSMRIDHGGLPECWRRSIEFYHTWSSRVLVNFLIFIFTATSPVVWAVFTGISMFVLMKSMKYMFCDGWSHSAGSFLVFCMIVMFPYGNVMSAGWIATTATYISPIAFGMLSLVPIKKVLRDEKIGRLEAAGYFVSLLYGANNEQVMVMILICYLAALVWYTAVKKKMNPYLMLYTSAAVLSAVFVATCPGNAVRKVDSIEDFFPTFEQMNFIDHAELGYETSAHRLIFGNNLFFEVFCVLLCVLVWKKYKDPIVQSLASVPAMIALLYGPFRTLLLKPIVTHVFPHLYQLADEIPSCGLVTPESGGGLVPYAEFMLMTLCLVIALVDVFLLCESWEQFLASTILLLAGFASMAAMGFSPTIYASGLRPRSILDFCVIAVSIYIVSINRKTLDAPSGSRWINTVSMMRAVAVLAALSSVELMYIVYTAFRG